MILEKNSHSNVNLALQTLIIYALYISFSHYYVLLTLAKQVTLLQGSLFKFTL